MLHKQNETEEYHLVIEVMRQERQAMSKIVFPRHLANATYKRLDEEYISPHLVQYLAHRDLRKIARDFLVSEARREEHEIEMEQEAVIDLEQYRLLPNYPGDRCIDCYQPKNQHAMADHEYQEEYCSIPIDDCTREELTKNADRLRREGSAKVKHGNALLNFVLRNFDFPEA